MAGVSASRRAAQLDMAKSDGPRARTADDVRPAARLGRVLVEHGVDGRLRLVARLAEHADSPARAAARDLRAVEARARRRRGDELDDAVCGGGGAAARREAAQQRLELADARVLEDGMGGAGGDGILRLRPDGGGCVAVAGGVLLQEGAAGEGGRQRRQGGELFGRQLRQVGQQPPLAEGGLQQGAAHEGGGADGAVVGAADRVAHRRIDAPHAQVGRDGDGAEDGRRAAEEGEEASLAAERASELVHDTARSSDHLILHLLAEEGDLLVGREGRLAEGGEQGAHARNLDRGRGGDARRLGHARCDEDGEASVRRRDGAVVVEHAEAADDVRGP
eukprot:CAMPEP_0202744102 /NCGR_PEP_ID=MMETSP1388-20130828/6308_1 /ASSEMBLY_ACC=CAM_ASM_000864 /TAXON_ID=37098 /ORGANISM="Isochrysis sp, Strain CCMP1244" /LENGTH=333 /DNA_ID=CAMNT_0049411165 /DNA_START=15 /DNA_END=1014 /DNA_ORIENTATION=+